MRNPVLIAGFVATAMVLAWPLAAPAAPDSGMPDFSGFWTRAGENPATFDPAPSGPSAITTAVAHHGHGADEASNAWIADITNPILQPWTRAALKKNADGEAKGISHLGSQENCKPSGVPEVLNLRFTVQVLQASDQVTILYENDQQVRRVYLNQDHPGGLGPSWYGHSVGHYEGGTLVIDTVAQNATTELDRFGTLHSDQLHVVERYSMLDANKMQVVFTVEDPKAFTMPWRGVATYRRAGNILPEYVCAENNRSTNLTQHFDVPTAKKADF